MFIICTQLILIIQGFCIGRLTSYEGIEIKVKNCEVWEAADYENFIEEEDISAGT